MADAKYVLDLSDLVEGRKEIRRWSKANTDAIDIVNSRMKTVGDTSAVAMSRAAREAKKMADQMRMSGKSTNRFGMVAQQVGYQVGDFFVQVQSGTNAMVAFGQQGTQLAGLLPGLAGAIVGIGLSVGTMLAGAFMRANEGAKELQDTLKSLDTSIKNLEQELFQRQAGIASGELATAGYEKQLLIQERAELIQKRANATRRERIKLDDQIEAINSRVLELGVKESRIKSVLRDLSEEEVKLLQQKVSYEHEAYIPLTAQAKAAQDYRNEMIQVFENAQKLRKELGDSTYEALRLAGVDMEGGITLAALAASNLSQSMKEALASALGLVDLSTKYTMMEGSEGAKRLRKYGGRGTTSDKDPAFGETGDSIYKIVTSSGGGGGASKPTVEEYLRQLQEEAKYKRSLVGLSEEEQRVQEIIYNAKQQELVVTEAQAKSIAELEEGTRKLIEAEDKRKSMMDMIEGNIEDAFMTMIDGSSSVEDAFKGMLRNILLEIYRQQVAKPIASTVSSLIGGLLGQADGGAWNKGVQMFADGGVISAPTAFRHSGGLGVMGEAGPEAIMPLKRGANGKLGVQMEGSQQPVVINQSFNFAANGDDSVKRIIAQEAPKIASLTQRQILDQRARGGAFKNTFG